jgi:hypothetical protein
MIEVRESRGGFRVTVSGRRARLARDGTVRLVYLAPRAVVKVSEFDRGRQNRSEAAALRSPLVRREALLAGVVLPRLLAVGPGYDWIAVSRLALRRPRVGERRRADMFARVARVMAAADRHDYDPGYWNWAVVGGWPAIYDLGV